MHYFISPSQIHTISFKPWTSIARMKVQDKNKIQLGENKLELVTEMFGWENNMVLQRESPRLDSWGKENFEQTGKKMRILIYKVCPEKVQPLSI